MEPGRRLGSRPDRVGGKEKSVLALKVASVVFVAIAMALALAHALEYPGKMRLDRSTYMAMQPIYYPGFAIGGGIGEGLGTILTFALLLMTPADSDQFNWVAAAFASLLAMQAVYWTVTHPVQNFWREQTRIGPAARRFFGLSATSHSVALKERESLWSIVQQRWEISHMARAFFGFISVVAITVAVAS
jgi:hypothetical protein